MLLMKNTIINMLNIEGTYRYLRSKLKNNFMIYMSEDLICHTLTQFLNVQSLMGYKINVQSLVEYINVQSLIACINSQSLIENINGQSLIEYINVQSLIEHIYFQSLIVYK